MKKFTATSSHGTLTVNSETGEILERSYEGDGDYLKNIASIDMAEWRATYPGEEPCDVDILDLAYIMKDGTYEPAEKDWRKEFKLNRLLSDEQYEKADNYFNSLTPEEQTALITEFWPDKTPEELEEMGDSFAETFGAEYSEQIFRWILETKIK